MPVEGDYLYAAETEVSNVQYREFLAYIKKTKGEDAYWEMYPDTTVWNKMFPYNKTTTFSSYYYQHPAYMDYPVVGVTKNQAIAYCNWLTEILSNSMPKGYKKIQVRLPTKQEWEDAARGGHPEYNLPGGVNKYRMGAGDKRKYQGDIIYNYTRSFINDTNYNYPYDNGNITTPVISYWPNDFGLYNMSGNIAEMVLDDTIVKGGSWNSSSYFMQIGVDDYGLNSNIPSNEVGFRYFIEVIEYDEKQCYLDKRIKINWADRNITQIDSNLYACENECTNRDYRRFALEFPQYAPKDSNWLLFGAKELFKKYSWHSMYSIHPVVNISYEAASKYCVWLTEKYNIDSKRKFKKVKFRLPSESEWEYAANGGDTANMFPWGGPYVRNSRGSFLGNFNPIAAQYLKFKNKKYDLDEINTHFFDNMEEDGSKYTNWVGCYYPNSFGLYNCAGNVAEMLQKEGVSKGGSWGSMEKYIQIKSLVTKDTPYFYSRVYLPNSETSPFLGFRYFMEVIEY